MSDEPTIKSTKSFWERSPVASAGIEAEPGTPEFYESFDKIRESEECEPLWLQERAFQLSEADGKKVLDIGCGNGYVLSQYAKHGAKTTGVDLTEKAIELSTKRFEYRKLEGEFVQIDGQSLPFEGETFDFVTSLGVLHHIPDPEPVIADAVRVLKPGGKMIIMMYHKHSWQYHVLMRLKRFMFDSYRGKSQQDAVNMVDGHANPLGRVYTRSETKALLEAHGLEAEYCETHQITWRQLLMLPPLVALAEKIMPPAGKTWFRGLGWNVYVRAKKPLS